MKVERLLAVADMLEGKGIFEGFNIPDNRFDLHVWYAPLENECGTASCAIGWACQHPYFMNQGLKLDNGSDIICHSPVYENRGIKVNDSWAAIRQFFGINSDTAMYLFWIHAYPSKYGPVDKQRVANRIRKFIESGGCRNYEN
jgi:hypothetical protein